MINLEFELWHGVLNPFAAPSAGWAHTSLLGQGYKDYKKHP